VCAQPAETKSQFRRISSSAEGILKTQTNTWIYFAFQYCQAVNSAWVVTFVLQTQLIMMNFKEKFTCLQCRFDCLDGNIDALLHVVMQNQNLWCYEIVVIPTFTLTMTQGAHQVR